MKNLQALSFNTSLFLILGFIVTMTHGLVFLIGHQIYRQSANDPQIQIASDMASYLDSGKDVKEVMPPMEVDINKSLVWFLNVYNDNGEIVVSNAKLEGETPILPAGVLEAAKQKGQNRVTWEPAKGVRIAAVVNAYEGGYVLAGRSLLETDNRIMMLGKKVIMVWVASLVLTFLSIWFLLPNLKRAH